MLRDEKIERVAEDSPDRCQALVDHGTRQCINKKCEGSNFCMIHGGNKAKHSMEREKISAYRLGKWKSRVQEFKDAPSIKSLRDELAILRMMLDERLELCNDAHELMISSGPISELIAKIEKLVVSCQKLDVQLGNMIDKSEAIHLAEMIIQIVNNHITDPEILKAISKEIETCIK